MRFKKINLSGWRQFENIEIDFHPNVTILTGANGAGKSTVLKVISQHFGWNQTMLATPTVGTSGVVSYLSGVYRKLFRPNTGTTQPIVGSITYSNDSSTDLIVPEAGGVAYNVGFSAMQPVQGLFIGSHRPIQAYQPISSIPTNGITTEQAYQTYQQETINRFNGGYSQFSPTYRMKEAIISMAMFGPGNQFVQRNLVLEQSFVNFKAILSKVLPPSLGFRDISVRVPDVVVVTDTGDFVIDAASGGLMSLIDLAWQIFLYSQGKSEFCVTLDEPENHLHPSMQRTLIQRLAAAFPQAQFIVATHSPFIVSSVKDSAVFVLRYASTATDGGVIQRISSLKLDQANKAGSASEILRDVLGVPVTLPEWAEDELQQIVSNFNINSLDSATIGELKRRLDSSGLGEYYPDALNIMVSNK